MIIKKRVIEECPKCGGHLLVSESIRICDICGQLLTGLRLQISINSRVDEGHSDWKDYEFCSWACVFEKLRELDAATVISVELPVIWADENGKEAGLNAFLEAAHGCIEKEMR